MAEYTQEEITAILRDINLRIDEEMGGMVLLAFDIDGGTLKIPMSLPMFPQRTDDNAPAMVWSKSLDRYAGPQELSRQDWYELYVSEVCK